MGTSGSRSEPGTPTTPGRYPPSARTGHRHSLWELVFPGVHLCDLMEKLMSQIDDLRQAISQVGVDLGEAVTRIEDRLADADVDLTPEIEQLRSFGRQLDSIAADTPVEEPEEPGEEEPEPGEEPFVPDQEPGQV